MFCFTVFLVLAGLFSCGGGGGGSASFSLHQPDDDLRNGGVSHGFGGNNNSSINSSRGGSATVVLTGSTSLNVDHYVYNGQSYSTAQELLEVMTGQNLTGETLVDVYVVDETTPRKAKYVATASGPVLRHPYKITIEDESGNPLFESVSSSGGDPQYVYSSEGIVVDADMIGNSGTYSDPMTILIDGTYVNFPVEKYLVNNGPAAVAPNGRITGFGEGDTITLTPKIGKYAVDSSCKLGISKECENGETIRVSNSEKDNNGKVAGIYIHDDVTNVKIDLSSATYTDGTGAPLAEWADTAISNSSQSKVTELTLPQNITTLANYALYATWNDAVSPPTPNGGCSSLTKVVLPSGLVEIGGNAFYGCRNLASVNIPNNVTTIGNSAFCDTAITSVIISKNVTSLGEYVFQNCQNLTSVTFQTPIAFGAILPAYIFSGCGSLSSVTIPSGITKIDAYAFNGCSNLVSVTIPDSVQTIETYAFQNCTSLTSVTIPAKTGTAKVIIGNYAFNGDPDIVINFGSEPSTNNYTWSKNSFANGARATWNNGSTTRNYTWSNSGTGAWNSN